MKKVLICDDEREILEVLELYLTQEGYNVIKAYDGEEAMKKVYEHKDLSLAIIDIMMPKIQGNILVGKIREIYSIPIIMLSAKNQDADKILALNLGADDYITKPFNPLEVVARVNAQIRRMYKLNGVEESSKNNVIKIGEVELDSYNIRVLVRGEEKELTSMEFGILKYLMENPGRILTKNQIFKNVWKEEYLCGDNTIMVHISRLRDKIELDSRSPEYLKTVRGLGYKFEKKV